MQHFLWMIFIFINWLYMFRAITSPSSGASSHKLYNALVCSCYQASLTVAWNTCWILAYCHFCVLSLIYLVAHMDVDIYFNIYVCWYCDCRTCCLLLYLPVLYLLLVTVTFLTFLVWWNMVTTMNLGRGKWQWACQANWEMTLLPRSFQLWVKAH